MTSIQTSRKLASFSLAVVMSAVSVASMAQVMVGGAPMLASKDIIDNAVNSKDHTTLVAAVKAAGLVDTLKGPGPFTVFAPTDEAFAKIPKATLDGLLADKAALTKVLTYHVVPGQIEPSDIAGMHKTVEGGEVNVTGSGENWMVNDAKVICGGVQTANATVYLIDSVLMPTD